MPERKQGLPRALRLRQGSGSDEACGRDEASESYGEVVAWEALVPIVTNPCIIGDVAMFSCVAFAFPAVVIPIAANFLGYAPTRPGLSAFFGLLGIIIGAFDAAYLLFSLFGLRNRFVARFVLNNKGVSMENGRPERGSSLGLSFGQALSVRTFPLPAVAAGVKVATVQATLAAAEQNPAAIWRPTHRGEKGNLLWVPRSAAEELLDLPPGARIDEWARPRARIVAVDDPAILRNVNTPAEWAALARAP